MQRLLGGMGTSLSGIFNCLRPGIEAAFKMIPLHMSISSIMSSGMLVV
jgi:hypothetical protein